MVVGPSLAHHVMMRAASQSSGFACVFFDHAYLQILTQEPQHKSMLGELTPCGGGDPIPLLKEKLLVGRRSSCDVTLRFPNVSSHHCELELVDGYWFVRDLGSRNGVKVNGEQIESKCLLPGDEVSFAKHLFEISYKPPKDGKAPEEESPLARGLLEKAGLEKKIVERFQREDVKQAERKAEDKATRQQAEPRITSEEEKVAFRYLRDMLGG